jgi:predicted RNA binding protein YcfA (HicA-like mRNA interferase family)
VRGSHYILRHPERSGIRITVPAHTRDLKPKTLATIIKQAGFTVDAFRELL